jgi:hypothetical protein
VREASNHRAETNNNKKKFRQKAPDEDEGRSFSGCKERNDFSVIVLVFPTPVAF